jgi:uncharacterized protein YfbU (UPF0304 family)
MKLTNTERLILINQFEIRKSLAKGKEDIASFDEKIGVLKEGHEILYRDLFAELNEDVPEDQGRFVLDVLDMYRAIETYKRENASDADVSKIPASSFRGFDGNDETAYYTLTRVLIKTQRKYTEQLQYEKKTDGFNSHMPLVPTYKKMHARWAKLGTPGTMMSKQVREVLGAEELTVKL